MKRQAYIKQQLQTRQAEEELDFAKLPRGKKEQRAIEKAKSSSKEGLQIRHMTYPFWALIGRSFLKPFFRKVLIAQGGE